MSPATRLFGAAAFATAALLPVSVLAIDGDDGVKPADFPYDRAMFDRLDADGDGLLRGAEIARAQKVAAVFARYPVKNIEDRFRTADKDGDWLLTADETAVPETIFERLDRDGDRKVTFEEALAVNIEDLLARMFGIQDKDLSGNLSPEEVTPQGRALFDVFDADGDGALSGEECYDLMWQAGIASHRRTLAQAEPRPEGMPAPKKPAARPGDAADPALAALLDVFRKRDADGDGGLDGKEFPGSRDLFGRSDIDGDGRVDEAELRVRRNRQLQLGQRAARLRTVASGLGTKLDPTEFAWYNAELKGLVDAGRLEEAERLLDEIELRIERHRGRG